MATKVTDAISALSSEDNVALNMEKQNLWTVMGRLNQYVYIAERLDATVANMRFVKPLDVELVTELTLAHSGGAFENGHRGILHARGVCRNVLLPDRNVALLGATDEVPDVPLGLGCRIRRL